jgi:hypothetical protein
MTQHLLKDSSYTMVPAILALEQLGYTVTVQRHGNGRNWWRAERAEVRLVAREPLRLLGLAKIHEARGTDWAATAAETQAVVVRHKVDLASEASAAGDRTGEREACEAAPDAQRPPVGVAHVVMHTDRMRDSAAFFRALGMRAIFDGPEVSVYEMRGGTHLLLMRRDRVEGGDAPFDLMVDDLRATHTRCEVLGLSPSPIAALPAIDHETFTLQEPAGHVLTIFSSHVSGRPT